MGASWEYQGIVDPITDRLSITRFDDGIVEVAETFLVSAGEFNVSVQGKSRLRCDLEGLWLVDTSYESQTTIGEDTQESRTMAVYSPPAMLIPNGLSVGDTWETHYSGLTSSDDDSGPVENVLKNEIVGEEEVTVPAGTFSALHVVKTTESSVINYWWDEEVGLVKGDAVELTAFEP